MIVDIERVARVIEEIAAAEILPRFRQLAPGDIREKTGGEVVTVVDEAVEARLGAELAGLLPGSIVVGEEAAATDAGWLRRLREASPTWIIDPIDGTSNFSEGRPAFASMVALVRGGEIVAGWIHDPVAGRTAMAAAREGAWMSDRRLRVAPAPGDPAQLQGILLAGHFGDVALGKRIQSRRNLVRSVRSMRSAGHEYLRLAAGKLHFALFTKLMPWDHAPGIIIHREAGGYGGYLHGGAYQPMLTEQSGLLLSPDSRSWTDLHRLLVAGS